MLKWSMFFASVCIALACKKETALTNPLQGKLKQISYRPVYADWTTYMDISYDAQGRVNVTELTARYDNGTFSPMEKIDYLYNASDTLPWSAKTETGGSRKTHYLFYNTQGKVVKDSILKQFYPTPVPYSASYSFTSNARMAHYPYPSGIFTAEAKDSVVFSNGNMVYYKLWHGLNNPNSSPDTYTTTYVYDNTVNPVSLLNIASVYHVVNRDQSPGYFGVGDITTSRNNLIQQSTSSGGTTVARLPLQRAYDSQGRPVKQTAHHPDGSIEYVIEFKYY